MKRTFFGFVAAAHVGLVSSANCVGCSATDPDAADPDADEMQELTADECISQGATTMPWDTCGSGREQLGVLVGDEGGACCETIPNIAIEDCEARGGTPHGDPGDGSSYRNGCPHAEKMIATLDFGIEGGICCK